MRKNKFFRNEVDFLSVESSLKSSDSGQDATENIKADGIFDEIKLKQKLTRSSSIRENFLGTEPSNLFALSQLSDQHQFAIPQQKQLKSGAAAQVVRRRHQSERFTQPQMFNLPEISKASAVKNRKEDPLFEEAAKV